MFWVVDLDDNQIIGTAVIRKLNAKKGRKYDLVTAPRKLKSTGIKRLIEDALWVRLQKWIRV